jgi:uncharacterized protein (TIGR03118 family)
MKKLVQAAVAAGATIALTAALVASAGAGESSFTVTKLVADQTGAAAKTDASLVNAWGLTSTPTSPWWVSDNGQDVSTLYRADGSKVPLTVGVASAPTGAVANIGSTFAVTNGTTTAPAQFMFATEEGAILAWNGTVSGTTAQVEVPAAGDAVFKGLAIASTPDGNRLYATDFHNGRVDVFDGTFTNVTVPGSFTDPHIPSGYAPFGIQTVGDKIVVTFAKQDADRHDDVAGQGHGFVDVFDTSGTLVGRVGTHGQLNSPWGIAMAPAGFGSFGGDLLVGNFGDGQISAFEPQSDGSYELVGQLRGSDHQVLTIDGLWALQFGKGAANNGPTSTLFFTAGPGGEQHGLFGTITAG